MFALLLAVIYLAFISLGLPDSLLGSAWPIMRADMGVPLSYAGIVTMLIASGTIVSSLLSDRLTRKLGAGLVTAISVGLTATALFGFSSSDAFWQICLWAVPYGLGAGAVDAALNNYVALHYASRHMNWLHCFWGVGASISPYIMSFCLTRPSSWNGGYRTVFLIQVVLTVILFASLPMWKKRPRQDETDKRGAKRLSEIVRIPRVKYILTAFFAYCAFETTTGLWASSYLTIFRGVDAAIAARYASLFFIGITAGRFVSGFVSDKIGDKNMIRIGLVVTVVGVFAVWLPAPTDFLCLNGLIVAGLGCAPIYPAVIHATPANFGRENSQAIVGVQMASAYAGSTFMPPLFGLIAGNISIGAYPLFLMFFAVVMLFFTEMTHGKRNGKRGERK